MQRTDGSALRDWLFLVLGIVALSLTLALMPDRDSQADSKTASASGNPVNVATAASDEVADAR